MKRRLRQFTVAASLVLLAALLVLWVRSHWRDDRILHNRPERLNGLWTSRGSLFLFTLGEGYVPVCPGRTELLSGWSLLVVDDDRPAWRDHDIFSIRAYNPGRFLGFAWANLGSAKGPAPLHAMVAIPFWPLALLLAMPPTAASLRAWWQRWHQRHNHCPTCGYDLRATPGRCPECGLEIDAPTSARAAASAAASAPSPRYSGERVGERGERRAESHGDRSRITPS